MKAVLEFELPDDDYAYNLDGRRYVFGLTQNF